MAAIISEKFRIFNAKQFLESLSEPSGGTDTSTERTRSYFFVGRPQRWYAYLELYAGNGTAFTVGEYAYVGANLAGATFKAKVAAVYPSSVLLYDVLPTIASTPGLNSLVKGADSGAQAYAGVYRYSNEEQPSLPLDNQEEDKVCYDDMIALKRITSGQARHVAKRNAWAANTKYDMWRPDYSPVKQTATGQSGLATSKYYLVNSNYEVFVCLYNGESPANLTGVNAVNEPSKSPAVGAGTYNPTTRIFKEQTGPYIWRFLYTIPTNDVIKFLSTDFMPIIDDPTEQAAAVDGAINVLVVKDTGASLPAAQTLYTAIVGDGTGGVAKLTTSAGGILLTAEVQTAGSSYTYGNILVSNGNLFSDASLNTPVTSTNARASIEVIIPPKGGHGKDPVLELNAKRVMLNVRLTYAEGDGDFPVDNDFRRIGIVQDPRNADGSLAVADTLSALYAVRLNNATGNFVADEEIRQNIGTVGSPVYAYGTVVSWTPDTPGATTGVLKYIQSSDLHTDKGKVNAFLSDASKPIIATVSTVQGSVVTNYSSSILGSTFSAGLASPEVKRYSGDIIYTENRRLISRAPDQIEDIKLVIEF